MRATSRTAIEMGDLVFACYGLVPPIAGFLLFQRSFLRGTGLGGAIKG